jgi:drug/metabolite transporter (DMT)-like permease
MLSRLSPVVLALLGTALLCVMDAVIKHLSLTNSALAIAFGRYVFGAAAAGAIWNAAGRPKITLEMLRAHAVRGVLIATSAWCFFYALGKLELVEAITLGFLAPLLIPFAAWALLGEKVRASSLGAGVLGFVGAVIAANGAPIEDQSHDRVLGIAAALTASVTYALSIALLRQRADKDGAPVIGLMQTLLPMAIVAGPAIALSPMPPLSDFPWFLAMGTLGAIGWYLLINAYARTEAQRLAPIEFTALIWASLFGFAIFQEIPRPQVYAGAALIIAACLFAAWEERRSRITPAPQTPIGD